MAYASYAFDKFAWMEKFKELHGALPAPQVVDAWIAQLPDSRLLEIQETAVVFFETAARDYMKAETDQAVKEALDNSILGAVRSATSFKQTVWGNLLVGVVSSFLFAAIIIAASAIFTRDPSPLALYKTMAPNSAPSPSIQMAAPAP